MPGIQPASNRIHVLEVIGNAIVGGMENHVARLIERLPAERFAVSVLCPFESPYTDQLRGLGAEVFVTAMPDDPSWLSLQMTSALVKAHAVDVLHAHLPNAHLLAGIAGKLSGKPVLATVHGRQITSNDLEVHRTCGTQLSVVCKQSYYHALGIGVNANQLHLIANGVDTDRFRPLRIARGPIRTRFGIPDAACVVGFVGRLSWEKGPDVFLRTALAVRQLMPEAHFVLVGEGPMRDQLQGFIEQFHLGAHVHLAGTHHDMPAVFGEFDVMLLTSHSEAMPLALMEAMASGLPVVATKVGGVADLVQHEFTGWLANSGDHDALAARVVDLLADASLRSGAGRAGRERTVERFGIADCVRSTSQLLARLAQPQAEPRSEQRRIGTVTSDGKRVGSGAKVVSVDDAAVG